MSRQNRIGVFAAGQSALLAALLTMALWPARMLADAPTVSDCAVTINVGGYIDPIPFSSYTSWTGDVSTLTYTNLTKPAHGKMYYSGGVPYEYDPTNGYAGQDAFQWRAANGSATSGAATFTIIISNDVPVANAGSWTGTRSVLLALPGYGLRFSFSHEDYGQTISYILSPPACGTACLDSLYGAYGYFDYKPNSDFVSGTDSFTFCVSDGISTSAPAIFTINLTSNTVPVANPVSCTVSSGATMTPLFTPAKGVNYTDPDSGQAMSCQVVTLPTNGTAYVDPSSGYIDYVSNQGFVGSDTFLWAVSDGMSTSTPSLVTLTVLAAPTIPISQTVVVAKNTPATFSPNYAGGGGYTYWLVKPTNPSHGSVVVTNGLHFCYKPNTNYVGADAFTWKMAYSNATSPVVTSGVATCTLVVKDATTNADWTQWRFDECRTAQTPMALPGNLYLQWRLDVPTCIDSFQGSCNDIDNCRPVQLGKQLFVSLMANDSVSAYNTDTGALNWRYYASGAVRRPPVAMALTNGTNVVIFGCDDGYVYCLNAANGAEVWKFRGAPNTKKAMVFGRLGSIWPVWGSPVAYQGKVYFVAGYLPTWGLFAYCLDAASGAVVWCNDGGLKESGYNSSLGPLTFAANHTNILGTVEGFNTPWMLTAVTGAFAGHTGATIAKNSGGTPYWYMDGTGVNAVSEPLSLLAGAQAFTPSSVASLGVSGTVGSMLAGDGKLFVATTSGSIYCFGGTPPAITNIYPYTTTPLIATNDVWNSVVATMLSRPDLGEGLALVWGVGSGRLVEELAKQATNLMIVAVDPDPVKLRKLRVEMDAAGWSGARVSTVQGNPMDMRFAPYQAAIIASEDVNVAGFGNGVDMVQALYTDTRPFGGEIWLPTMTAQHTAIADWMAGATNMPLSDVTQRTGLALSGVEGFTQIRRLGLPDSALIFKPPFRVTAFGVSCLASYSGVDTLNTRPVYGANSATRGVKAGYDIYSWLPVADAEPGYEPPQPTGVNTSRAFFVSGNAPMVNPVINHLEIPPPVWKLKSCVENFGYGSLAFSPGKQGAIMDAANYWGVFLIPEMRGCGGACFAVNGIANFAPDGPACNCVAGMTCTQIGVVPVTDQDEEYFVGYQWSRSQESIQETPVRRIGINFGAPDQRYDTAEGLLWTHHPMSPMLVPGFSQLGEANPLLAVTYRGGVTNVYHHSVNMSYTNPANRNWVSASFVKGMDGITIPLASPLVATRVAAPPVLDGSLNDVCWGTSNCAHVVSGGNLCYGHKPSPYDSAYAMLRYDDTNLYVAGGLYQQDALYVGKCSLQIALSSRERLAPTVLLACGSGGKITTGMDSNAWQVAYTIIGTGTNYNRFQAEMAIPWSALAAVGIWKESLLLNFNITDINLQAPSLLNGTTSINGSGPTLDDNMSPVYFDAAKGAVAQATPHNVKLYFAEMEGLTNGQRVFDVQLQGQTVLTNFDVYAASGAPKTEVVRVFPNVMIADHLNIDFVRHAGEPMLSGAAIIDAYTNADGTHMDAPNMPPMAVITVTGGMTNGPAPLAVTFSARNSYDPDGQIMECAWEMGDGRLAKGSLIQHIFAEPGIYTVNLLVVDNSGATATTNITVTVTAGAPSAFVCNIRSNGLAGCDYTTLTAWNTAIKSDLTSPNSLLFTVSDRGSYVTNDDGHVVTFNGNGTGVLKHISASGLAYVTGCNGTILAGPVTCGSHTFTISDTGSRIVTAVAQCYNDWPNGLNNNVAITGWTTETNHCVTIRGAPGQGLAGKLRQGPNYAGFTIAGKNNGVDVSAAAYTRLERIMVDGAALMLGAGASVNRVIATNTMVASKDNAVIANSVAGTFVAVKLFGTAVNNVSYYNCTGGSFVNNATGTAPAFNLRYVNCLAIANGSGFAANTQLANCPELYRSQCVSVDGTATDTYVSEQCLSGNAVNQPVSLLSVATNGDYRLAPTDTGASGKGGPGLGADITGAARTGPAYDAGAYQLPNHAPLISGGPWATPNPVNTNTAVMFTTLASDLDGNALSCTWTFGDSGSASGINVTYTYISLGVYTARVVVSDGQLAATGSVVVSVATGSVASAVSAFDTWRIAHFGSTNAVGAGASDDPLQVGMNNLQKYLLGMDPNDPNSTYKMLRIQPLSSSNGVWWYGGTTNTGFINLFAVETCTNLGGTGWGAKATGLPNSATGTNVWWDTNLPASVPIFYRITTQLNMP